MIVRFSIDPIGADFEYRVSYEGEDLYADSGLGSVVDCIVAATEGLGPDAVAAELSYKGIISGTYPLATLAVMYEQVALHAVQTTEAVEEVLGED